MTRVLVPLAILEGESASAGLTTLLEPMNVTVLGYHELPEQTPPDQARLQYEERATDALEGLATEFGAADGTADYRLVFTHDRTQTFDRVAAETKADVYAIPGTAAPIDRLLVALTGDVAVERIVSFVGELVCDRDIGVTLFLATDDESAGRELLDTAALPLAGRGIDVRTELAVDELPLEALVDAAVGHGAIVVGERAPSLRTLVFGEEAERIAAESVGPVLVVRHVEEGAGANGNRTRSDDS
ncbi:universal stress protein [Natronococcus wangiae]|uniref:universal stress protein n=1 Tax=Natronococcus wangiae TaxID=3068275 RepID=UPI00273E052B|nr:universal stress protein [Natronococcus sp. AD5]